jgi:hypothetical protein
MLLETIMWSEIELRVKLNGPLALSQVSSHENLCAKPNPSRPSESISHDLMISLITRSRSGESYEQRKIIVNSEILHSRQWIGRTLKILFTPPPALIIFLESVWRSICSGISDI